MKIAIIGSGSTYTPELIEGIINRRNSLPITEMVLMDIDERKLTIVGNLCKRMVEAAKLPCSVKFTQDLDEALKGASFVLAQIRVGKLPARVKDEKIPLKYNLIGQETMGIGGFFKALRTVPQILHIADRMAELCPDAWLINFSNPSGIVAQAVLSHTNIKMLGLCNVPYNMTTSLTKRLGLSNPEFDYVGLNHLSWITSIRENGKDYLADAIENGINSESMKNIPTQGFPADVIKTIGAIPSPYLEYVYYKDEKLAHLKTVEKCRGEVCMEIEEQLLTLYSNKELCIKPELLSKRGGANYSLVAISLVDAIYNDKQEVHIVNARNSGALDFLDDDDVIEVSAVVGKNGATPVKVTSGLDNQHIVNTVRNYKTYERYAVDAAITGNVQSAVRAMLSNPLIYDYKTGLACFKDLYEAHKEFLPQFAGKL